ncbi:HAD family hydrolase [Paenibacillus sp. GCM10027629]|uniref:HAD family hydrolase n=1 Tax=Paenibacillus sp. GCM10027629 TaxID=3273414 RepID=UPI00363FFBC6
MQNRPQVIFDVAGVLISNFSPQFWDEIVTYAEERSATELRRQFKSELRQDLWSGAVPDTAFFTWISAQIPAVHAQEVERILYSHLVPLPAMERLSRWSQSADLHLLTNHRTEWITPLLHPVQRYITSMTVSSETGYCKPDQRIFQSVQEKLRRGSILYVDDQQKNFAPAVALGWRTLLADETGNWLACVDELLL